MTRLRMLLRYVTVGLIAGIVLGIFAAFKQVSSYYNYGVQWGDVIYEAGIIFAFAWYGICLSLMVFGIVVLFRSKIISKFFKGKF